MAEEPVRESAVEEWGWEAHERDQRRRFANASLADKIAWLEEAQRMVLFLEQQRSGVRDRTTEVDSED